MTTSDRVRANSDALCYMCRCSNETRRAIIQLADKKLIDCISECCLNILRGNINLTPYQRKKLMGYKHCLRKVASKAVGVKDKKRILQKGGFLGAILAPLAAGVLSPLISNIVGKVSK